jgi:hypothetical protein
MPPQASAESRAAVEAQVRRLLEALRELPREAEPAVTFDVIKPPDEAGEPDE